MWTLLFVPLFLLNGVLSDEPSRLPAIHGGVEADISEVPYQVALYHYGGFQCGASILNEWYILTAAHCVDFPFLPVEFVTFRAGSADNRDGGVIVQAENITIHPNYDYLTFDNDVAIVKLVEPLELNNETIMAVTLADEDFVVNNLEMAQVSGWGRLVSGVIQRKREK